MKLHLAVIQLIEQENCGYTQAGRLYSSVNHDFSWNDDFTAFRPIKLRWHDDASYAAYQAGDDR